MRNTVSPADTILSDVPSAADVTTFIAVAECASFTAAARRLGVGKSGVGKAVQRLEARLGVPLLRRSTRVVRLTDEGTAYLEASRDALSRLREAGRAVSDRLAAPSGSLRVSLPAGIGYAVLPLLAEFMARYPEIVLEITLADRFVDVLAEGWDVAVRVGALEDSALVARKLCDLRFGLYAAPAYLARRGVPAAIADLPDHNIIVLRTESGFLKPWPLCEGGVPREIALTPRLVLTDSAALIAAAAAGLGIALCFDATAAPAVRVGQVRQILPETSVQGPSVYALMPSGRAAIPAKTRVFVEHIALAMASA